MQKNILIYMHMPKFNLLDGGTTVEFNLAKILEELNQNVRIYSPSGIMLDNFIFNKYYQNDFPIDDNAVVVYCEGTTGNPLGAKNVVRWMLSVLGQNVPHEHLETWGKNELVYHFNSEPRFHNFPERMNVMYKMLSSLYVNPDLKQTNFNARSGVCYTIRKAPHIHRSGYYHIHPNNSFEINWFNTQNEYIEFFNNYEFFISYDSNTFLTMMAAICGCISIVYKVDGLSKKDWLKTTAAADYLEYMGLENLYGISYGLEDLQYAKDNVHLAKNQWDEILNYCKEKTIVPFINDINNFENMQNTIQNNYYV